jgi:predicted component of type VI protein secretion system
MLPELSTTRWRKKSDFYTLFLAVAERGNELPFAREARNCVREELLSLAERVDRFLREPEQDPGQDVRTYSTAVERAASDLASRRRRAEVVRAIIAACVPDGAMNGRV